LTANAGPRWAVLFSDSICSSGVPPAAGAQIQERKGAVKSIVSAEKQLAGNPNRFSNRHRKMALWPQRDGFDPCGAGGMEPL